MCLPEPALACGLDDHALFVVALLANPAKIDADGWRPLVRKHLERRLRQQCLPGGKKLERATLLLGTAKAGGGQLVEAGIVEVDRSYIYGDYGSAAQRYRLAKPEWRTAPRKWTRIELKRGQAGRRKAAPAKSKEPPIPPWLVQCYRERMGYDIRVGLRTLCRLAGLDVSLAEADQDIISKAIWSLPEPEGARGRRERREKHRAAQKAKAKEDRKRMAKIKEEEMDPRAGWQAALEHLYRHWSRQADGRGHRLHRAFGRLFSPFTSLKKELRSCATLDGEALVEIDVTNAQPWLIAVRMVQAGYGDVEEVRRYVRLCVEGRIYEYAFRMLHGREPTKEERDEFKGGFYGGWMFCDIPDMDRSDFGKAMRRAFPFVDAWVREEKSGPRGFEAFPTDCQRFEASLFVDRVGDIFERHGVAVATVHDGLYVKVSDAVLAEHLMRDVVLADLPVALRPQVRVSALGG